VNDKPRIDSANTPVRHAGFGINTAAIIAAMSARVGPVLPVPQAAHNFKIHALAREERYKQRTNRQRKDSNRKAMQKASRKRNRR
jgi:hypothetical protein